ncbi:MAG: hypothetical protein WD602_10785 [Actinomycetota bacterium]
MNKLAGAACALVMVLTATSCSDGKIPLTYSFDEPEGTHYLWKVDSATTINSSTDQSSTRLEMEIEVHERILEESGHDDPVLAITLTPEHLRQDGQELALPEPVTVRYLLNPEGHIVELVDTDVSASAASALELGGLLARSRIPLPESPVGIGGTWDAPLVLEGQTGSFDMEGQGRLLGFSLQDRRRLAEIEIDRSGEVTGFEQLAGVLVQLRGRSTSTTTSRLDIDRGVLLSSYSEFSTSFDMSRLESGQLAGTLDVSLTSELELQPE